MRKIRDLITAGFFYLAYAVPALADTATPVATGQINACPPGTTSGFGRLCALGVGSLGEIVGKGINFLFIIAAIVALGYLIYGAVKWIVSEGEKTNVESARNQIVAAIIGLVIIALSYLIINLVLGFFLGRGLQNLDLPSLQ